jgi:DNA-binding LacI/PurR family transcriptional regulator
VSEESRYRGHGGRANILDVAERAGVSPATVSRSLRGIAKVSADTRRRVLDAARELDYVSLLEATSIEAGPRRSVAVIVPYIARWFFGAVTAGAVDYLRTQGFDVTLYHLGSAEVRDRFFERMPIDPRVAGILTLSMPLTEQHTLALRAIDLPLVSVGTSVPGSPSVGIDESAAGRSAVNHLLHLGHERIGMIVGRADERGFDFISSEGRRDGARAALEAAGLRLDDALVAEGPHGPEGGAAAMAELLTRPILPTAVFAEYDELAIGALWALRRAGLDVPGDVSVVGVDDHEMAAMLDLTTVAQSVPEQGEVAAQLLLELLDGEQDEDGPPTDEAVKLATRLVLRGTTAPPTARRVTDHRQRRRGRSRTAG